MVGSIYSWRNGRLTTDESGKGICNIDADGHPKVALVIGITGIVGTSLAKILPRSDTPGAPWKVYGVARRPQPRWFEETPIDYIQCNVLDRAETQAKITHLRDVTHLFWVVWVKRSTEERNCKDNGKMFQNVLDVLLPNAPNLKHVVLQTGAKHYIGPFDLVGKIAAPEVPFKEDAPRLPVPNFYHTLEDILLATVAKKDSLTWSVHRPAAIIGFSPWSLMNLLGSLATYAVICKHEGLPFHYPGTPLTWEQCGDLSDAELIAEQEIWACVDPNGKNQALNVTNGDVLNYKRVWSLLAETFGLEVVPYDGNPRSLEVMMKDKGSVWDAIVEKHGLLPIKLEDVGNWAYVDVVLNLFVPIIASMNKSKDLGFLGYRNTEVSILNWINEMRRKKIIP